MINKRTCIACRTRKPKEELVRIIAKDNIALIDDSFKVDTRGMYICKNKECINKLLKAKDISKCVKIKATKDSVIELLKNMGE